MLHYAAVDTATLELLKGLLQIPFFSELRLAGGTSLALQIGHRKSIDLDLFGNFEADELSISEHLRVLGKTTLIKKTSNIQIYLINGIKVDIVNYYYPWIEETNCTDKLRLAGKKDIAAMKLAAITGRGTKKDFIDIYFLLQEFTLEAMLDYFTQKFHDGSPFLAIKSLAYFNDADQEQNPFMLRKISWSHVKQSIINSLEAYLKSQ
jgi:predicted nucleotidyltransferase component of viral defense system